MKTNYRHRAGFTLVELLVVIVIIAALAGLSAPMILKQRKAADRTEAISNVKQIQLALIEFDSQYGSFPDNNTQEDVKDSTGSALNFGGNFSNDYFRQLIATGVDSEKIFWCKTSYSPRKPDDNKTPGKALEEGEVGFGYVMASQTDGQSSSGEGGRPVVVSPLYKGEPNWEFDPDPYGDKAVILRIDGSATAEPIRTNDRYVSIQDGRFLQSTGDQTPWGDVNPVLRPPQKKAN